MTTRNRKNSKNASGIQALAQAANTFARANVQLEKTEKELEHELERDNREIPSKLIPKLRHYGEKAIHSKQVLLGIVLLNVLDCILVLGELMLDIHHVKNLLEQSEEKQFNFLSGMKELYPLELMNLQDTDVQKLYDKILIASIHWNTTNEGTAHSIHKRAASTSDHSDLNTTSHTGNSTHDDHHEHHHEHSIEEKIAHGFHYASISILCLLVLLTIFKVFCFGKEFLGRRLEVFDSFIIIASFIVDLVFIKGLSSYPIQEFVLILAFLVPWRVIRVVNSLVVAVMDHEHFLLKLLYKQKKEVEQEMKTTKAEKKTKENCVNALKKLCESAGVPQWKIGQHLSLLESHNSKSKTKLISSLYNNAQRRISNGFINGLSSIRSSISEEGKVEESTLENVDETKKSENNNTNVVDEQADLETTKENSDTDNESRGNTNASIGNGIPVEAGSSCDTTCATPTENVLTSSLNNSNLSDITSRI